MMTMMVMLMMMMVIIIIIIIIIIKFLGLHVDINGALPSPKGR